MNNLIDYSVTTYIRCGKAYVYVQSRLGNVNGVMYGLVLFIHLLIRFWRRCSQLDASDTQRLGLVISSVEDH